MRQSLPDENLQAVTWLAETNKGNRMRPAALSAGWVWAHFPEQRLVIEPSVKVDEAKVQAIRDMAAPTDIEGVKGLCGMAQYMAKFSPNLAATL